MSRLAALLRAVAADVHGAPAAGAGAGAVVEQRTAGRVGARAYPVAALGRHHVVALAVAAVLLDMAVQATMILGQHTIYRLDQTSRARLNSAYIAIFFVGGAAGSQLGSYAYRIGGWPAVTAAGAALPLLALLAWTTEPRRPIPARP
jgi:predicted MFS family arabinose efflux permease